MNWLKNQWRLFIMRRDMERNPKSVLEIDLDERLAFRKANREHFAKLARSDRSKLGWETRRKKAKS